MAAPAKILKELEGDTPEMLAWGLLEWVRQVEDVRDRHGILEAFADGLKASGLSCPADALAESTGSQRRIAYRLTHLVAEMEGRSIGQRNQGDRKWILDTYSECLDAAMGRRKPGVRPAPIAADSSDATDAPGVPA
jgi:hypothetical protein